MLPQGECPLPAWGSSGMLLALVMHYFPVEWNWLLEFIFPKKESPCHVHLPIHLVNPHTCVTHAPWCIIHYICSRKYIVTCQTHPALVKRVQWSVRIFQFLVVYPWPVSRHCLEPRWFVRDPTSLARDNMLHAISINICSAYDWFRLCTFQTVLWRNLCIRKYVM